MKKGYFNCAVVERTSYKSGLTYRYKHYLELKVDSSYSKAFYFSKKGLFSSILQKVGLVVKVKTGDLSFDEQVYVESADAKWVDYYFLDQSFRSAILNLFDHGFTNIKYERNYLIVDNKGSYFIEKTYVYLKFVRQGQVEQAGLDWEKFSRKLIENDWAQAISPGKLQILERFDKERSKVQLVFGAQFRIIMNFLRQNGMSEGEFIKLVLPDLRESLKTLSCFSDQKIPIKHRYLIWDLRLIKKVFLWSLFCLLMGFVLIFIIFSAWAINQAFFT